MKWDTHTFTFILLLIVGLWELARGFNAARTMKEGQVKLTARSYYLTGAVVLIAAIYYAYKLWG